MSKEKHKLIEKAKLDIKKWNLDNPREFVLAASSLCLEILDYNGLAKELFTLRGAFEIQSDQPIGQAICLWDEACRAAEWPIEDNESMVKVGVVTWITKFVAKQLHLLPGAEPISDHAEWKRRLCDCLDKYIVVS